MPSGHSFFRQYVFITSMSFHSWSNFVDWKTELNVWLLELLFLVAGNTFVFASLLSCLVQGVILPEDLLYIYMSTFLFLFFLWSSCSTIVIALKIGCNKICHIIQTNKTHLCSTNILYFTKPSTCFEPEGSYSGRRYKPSWRWKNAYTAGM